MKKNIFASFILFFTIYFSVYPINNELYYAQKLSISEGLPHNGVTSVLEDSKGFIWVGTFDGLCRYDGYECKVFKNTVEQKYFVSNRIRCLYQDLNNNLWIGTDEGVTIYNYDVENFTNLFSNRLINIDVKGPIVRKIIEQPDGNGILCLTETEGLLLYNKSYKFIKKYTTNGLGLDKEVLFFDGAALDKNNFLFSTSIGLVTLNLKTGALKRMLSNKIYVSRSVYILDKHRVLVSSNWGMAVLNYRLDGGELALIHQFDFLNSDQFLASVVDKNGNLWLSTVSNGIVKASNIQRILSQQPVDVTQYNKKNDIVRASCLILDSNHRCLAGTFNEGLMIFDTQDNAIKGFNSDMNLPFGLKTNEIQSIRRYGDNRAYITSNRGGVVLFNSVTETFEPLPFDLPSSGYGFDSPVFVDSRGNNWLRFNDGKGLRVNRPGSRGSELMDMKDCSMLITAHLFALEEDKFNHIWIGSDEDVFRLTLDANRKIVKIESLNKHPFFKNHPISKARVLYIDPAYDFLWIGTNSDGLLRINLNADVSLTDVDIVRFSSKQFKIGEISSNFVTAMYRFSNGDFWIATEGGGICKVDKSESDTPYFNSYTESQGLSNNVVKGMIPDKDGNLWLSTNIGLNKFSTKDKMFRKFSKTDKMPFENFSYGAQMMKNGIMIFGGMDGFIYFNPSKVPEDETLPKLEFGSLKIFNEEVRPLDTIHSRVLLQKRLSELEAITLKHDENVFSIEVISLHFGTIGNHYLKYQLWPLNKEWIQVPSGQKAIYYNGLPPGTYELRVMASNAIGKWTKAKTLSIVIKPPFWKTIPAFILYFIVVLIVAFFTIRFIVKLNSLKYRLKIEQIEKDSIKEINAAKLRFFSNISHEIKTPLTLIIGPIKQMAERYVANTELSDKLQLVLRQTKKIFQLVEQVHDFQRAEAYQLTMTYATFSIHEFVNDIRKDFDFLAKSDQKILTVIEPDIPVFVSADADKLEKIFNNLLSNAFRHTEKNDTIEIAFAAENRDLVITIKDSGEGIAPEDLDHVFERFYSTHKKRASFPNGSGIGLAFTKRLVEMHYGYIKAESVVNQGTVFTVRLPVVVDKTEDEVDVEKVLALDKKHETQNLVFDTTDISKIKTDSELSSSRIFFAEDNADMRRFVSAALSNFFEVKTFSDGKGCLEAMQEEWPDLVLSDVQMPVVNGFELCRSIKTDIKTSHIPVILLTALTAIDDEIQGIREGADDYIQKPFSIEHLVVRIEAMLKQRKQLRERFQIDFPLTLEHSNTSKNDTLFIEKLYSLMAENLDNQELELDNFARQLYLNRTHFYQKVKALTNQTPFELMKMYRLKKAAELLSTQSCSVNEVFERTGFKSRTHFSKLFKEVYNVTPGKFAEEVAKKYN